MPINLYDPAPSAAEVPDVAALEPSAVELSSAPGRCRGRRRPRETGVEVLGAGIDRPRGRRKQRKRGLRRGLCHFALGLLRGALLLHLRPVVENLPAEQHEAGQNDGKDGVAIIGHRSRSRHSIRFTACARVFL